MSKGRGESFVDWVCCDNPLKGIPRMLMVLVGFVASTLALTASLVWSWSWSPIVTLAVVAYPAVRGFVWVVTDG